MKISSLISCIALVGMSLTGGSWGADRLPSVESFFSNPDVTQAVMSPKGNYIAFIARNADGSQKIAVRATADLKNGEVVNEGTVDDKILSLHWVNEDRLVFIVKSLKTEFIGNTDVIAVNRDGTGVAHLISGDWEHTAQSTGSNISSKILTADYAFFSAAHDNSDDIIVRKYLFSTTTYEIVGTRLYRLNTKTHKLSELLDGPQPPNVTGWWLDASDVPRIAASQAKGKCIISYLDPKSNVWSELANADCYEGSTFNPVDFESSDTIIVSKSFKGLGALYRFDLNKKQVASEPFLNIAGMDFEGSIETDYGIKKMIGIHYDGDAKATVWFDPHFKDIQQKVDGILKSTINEITCGTDCINAPAVLVKAQSDRQPTQYFVYNVVNNSIIGIGGEHSAIKPAQMGMRDFAYFTARDGLKIPVYVTLPPGKSTTPKPTIVLVHGGPWVRGSSWEWEPDAQFLASRGYVVIQPEFRGSEGFGHAFFKAGWKQWGQSMQDDLADAANWAVQKGWADPKRVAIMGASYGGYATLMGLIKHPDVFRCGVEWAGVTDMGLRYSTPQDDATSDVLNYDLKTLMGDPVADADMFKQNSPLQNADKLKQPLLIAHGALDRRVPIVHATDFYSAVKKHNNNVEWIVYSDEGHGWYHEPNRYDFWKRVEAFLDKNLKNVE